jgi:hypothetical protein
MSMTQKRTMRSVVPLLIASNFCGVVSMHAPPAYADDTLTQCIAANDKGIDLRRRGKLIDARKALAACAVTACGADIKGTCEAGIAEISSALPSIVFAPKDRAGNDIAGVRVSIDGLPQAESLDGRALTVDPGTHLFKFETAGQPPVEKSFVLSEKEKDRRESIVIGPVVTVAAPAPIASPASSAPSSGPHFSGWVLGGIGLAGVAAGIALGVVGQGDHNDAVAADVCNGKPCPSNMVPATATSDESTANTLKDAGYVAIAAGGALLVSGIVVLLVTRRSSSEASAPHAALLQWQPWVSSNGAGSGFSMGW